ncbi:sulfoxide reductase heme-binding subunit YedZ [Amorphus sp. MBR-141]
MLMDMPWNDRAGRVSALRIAALLLIVLPALILAIDAATGGLGAKPLTEAIHRTGDWAVRLLLVTLAVTPLRRIGGWGRLVIVRRLLGLAAFGYALAHLTLYAADQNWNPLRVITEIVSRIYLTVGFVTLAGLAVLAATSTDAAIRRMGSRWHKLHQIAYGLTALAILHFFMQSKIDAWQAALMMGFWLLLMGWRLAHKLGRSLASPLTLAAVAVLAALATALLEAVWYGVSTRVPWQAILSANLSLDPSPRPAVWVLVVGLAAALLPLRRGIATRRAAPARS